MAKVKEAIATLDEPKAAKPKRNWKFNLRAIWLPPIVTVEGAETETEARKELHRRLDRSIFHVEPTR